MGAIRQFVRGTLRVALRRATRKLRRLNHEPRCGSVVAVTPEEVMNRLTEYFGSPGTPPPPETFWLVYTEDTVMYVSPETAEALGREIARVLIPRWVRFTDVVGSEWRIRARTIRSLEESTADQRALARALHKALREEGREDGDYLFC